MTAAPFLVRAAFISMPRSSDTCGRNNQQTNRRETTSSQAPSTSRDLQSRQHEQQHI
jgi:hypothetical protein